MKTEKRTQVDWSKHELIIEEHPNATIWRLKVPDTVCRQVNFINTEGRLLVTGDYSTWVFVREFYPGADGFVSDGYWHEKLRMANQYIQMPLDWDYILKAIRDFPAEHYDKVCQQDEEDGEEMGNGVVEYDIPEDVKDWLEDLKGIAEDEDELEYLFTAYRKKPCDISYEEVPYSRGTPPHLNVVFDAFDEICRRLKEGNCEK